MVRVPLWLGSSWFTSFPAGIFLQLPKHPHMSVTYWRDLPAQSGTRAKPTASFHWPHILRNPPEWAWLAFFLLLFSGLQVMLASWCAWWKDFNEKPLIWYFCPSLRTGSWTALTSTPVRRVWSIGAVQVSAETTQSWATAQGNISLFHFLLCSERGREVSFSNKQILLCSWSEGWTQSPY